MPLKKPKIFVMQNMKVQLITVVQADGSKDFAQVARTLMMKQSQV